MKTLYQLLKEWKGLLIASVFSLSTLLVRMHFAGNHHFRFLVWNLFLAFIPFGISMYLSARKNVSKWLLLIGILLWLLFFPNAPYVISDLGHITKKYGGMAWFDVVMLFSFAMTAITVGIISLVQIKDLIKRQWSESVSTIFLFLMMPLTGYGIYLGRFERWNSWDLLTHPHALLFNCLENLTNLKAVGVTFAFAGCFYITFQLIQQASKTIYDTDKKSLE